MKSRLPIDEINALSGRIYLHFNIEGHIASKKDCDDIIDELLDLFLLAYAESVRSVNEQFGTDIEPSAAEIEDTVYRTVDGATWVDRVKAWYKAGGTRADIMRIAETEAHRISNEAAFRAAERAGAQYKTWICQMLPTSRDTHIWLNKTTVPIDGYFYSYAGGQTLYPGEWGIPEEDVNCLCELEFK